MYRCLSCDEITENDAGPLYECGECGTQFTRGESSDGVSHRCPDCNRFASKIAESGCPECGEGELVEIQEQEEA